MTPVYWLEQKLADVPPGSRWLSEGERMREATFRVPKRQEDWRLGRWAAKQALLAVLERPSPAYGGAPGRPPTRLEDLVRAEIRPAASGVPEAFWDGAPLPWSLSISHTAGRSVAALAPRGAALGCDLERIEPRSPAFLEDSFTAEERAAIAGSPEPAFLATLFWSAKESVLKALGQGLRLPLQSLAVAGYGPAVPSPGWRPFRVRRRASEEVFEGYWRGEDSLALAIAARPSPGSPIALAAGG